MKDSLILFELPIYICDEDTYYNKWLLKKNAFIEHQIKTGGTVDDANDSFFRCNKYSYLWDYNKIIGFIRIKYDSITGDLKFNVFKQNKKVLYNVVNKMQFEEIHGPNLRIYARKVNNDNIVKAIMIEISYIKDNFFKKNYIETSSLEHMLHYIDFEKMIIEYDNYRK